MLKRKFSTTATRLADFTHTIIGAGVIGLAVASELVKQSKDNRVLIIEKNKEYGQETSSRNSEVVHAGLYYPINSLKTEMCIKGKEMIYERKELIPTKQCGKWIVAQNENEMEYLEKLHEKSKQIGVLTEFIPLKKARELEPSIRANYAVLNSPTTGITSAHGLMDYLYTQLQEGLGDGNIAFGTKVIGVNNNTKNENVYEIITIESETNEENDPTIITTNNVVNCAGLHAPTIANMILPKELHFTAYYAKGNYFSYNGPNPHISRLIYPCPTPSVASLGTHLTLDLGGQLRFGPDLEWIDNCDEESVYKVSEHNLVKAFEAVSTYFPGVKNGELHGSYSGVRPKLIGPGIKRFQDFVVREERAVGAPGWVNLLGIESPGLTSAMALGVYVSGML
jgi:L-2-hydroxyglutarate oxidase LhgO